MTDVVSGQDAFMLHARPYRETSRIVELLTRDQGRVAVVHRGARSRRGSSMMQFVPLQVEWRGRGNLKTLTGVEAVGMVPMLGDERLASGLYANELLMRVLRPMDAHESLFEVYAELVAGLVAGDPLQPLLRHFECQLLQEIGYGISFSHCGDSGAAIDPQAGYGFAAEQGFYPLAGDEQGWPGWVLLAIAGGDFAEPAVRTAAKHILRLALSPHLGARPLESRRLLVSAVTGKAAVSTGE